MREILFKAKRLDNGEWVEGDLIREQDVFGNIKHRIYQIKGSGRFQKYDVDAETICQYTELTDKNGKKIWENDVVAHTYTVYVAIDEDKMSLPFFFKEETKVKNYVIKWDNTASYMGYRYHNARNIFPFKWGTVYNGNDEVIGNIFDNLKLLRGESDGQTD